MNFKIDIEKNVKWKKDKYGRFGFITTEEVENVFIVDEYAIYPIPEDLVDDNDNIKILPFKIKYKK